MRVVWDCDCIALYGQYTTTPHMLTVYMYIRTPLPLTCSLPYTTTLHNTPHEYIYTHTQTPHPDTHTERNTRSRVQSPPRLPPPAARSIEEAQWGGRKKERNTVSESAAGVFTVLPTDAQILQQELIAFPLRQFLCVRKERKEESKGGLFSVLVGQIGQKKVEKKKKRSKTAMSFLR